MDCLVVAVNDVPEGYPYPPEVRFEISEQDLSSYRRAGDFLNFANAEIVCLQHEFGIYGGPSGRHILTLLRSLTLPVVTHFHTVVAEPSADQMRIEHVIRALPRIVQEFPDVVYLIGNYWQIKIDWGGSDIADRVSCS
jgi:hypothetical protein